MSIKIEDYYAPATFQRMKAFADTQETPFVVIDTAIISQAYDDLRAYGYTLWLWETGTETTAGWICLSRDDEAMRAVAPALGIDIRPGSG